MRMIPVATWDEAAAKTAGYEGVAARHGAGSLAGSPDQATPGNTLSARELQVLSAFGIALARLGGRPVVRVLDIGGGPGSYGHRVIKEFPTVVFEWTILETPTAAAKLASESTTDAIGWTDTPTVLDSQFDVILASAVINYVPEPYELLARSAAAAPFVIVNRLPLWPFARDIPAVQKVSRRRDLGSYPTWFFSERLFRSAVGDLGEVVCEWEVPQDSTVVFGIRRNYCGMLIATGAR